MYKIAVLGDYDSIYGFAALGLDIFPVSEPEESAKLFAPACRKRLRRDLCDGSSRCGNRGKK